MPLKVVARRNHAVAYAKRHETILDLLALTGAGETALRLEEDAVVAATRAEANRLANADEANLLRTAQAAHRQLEAIRAVGAESLPPRARRGGRAAAAPSVRLPARAGRRRPARRWPRRPSQRRLQAIVDAGREPVVQATPVGRCI